MIVGELIAVGKSFQENMKEIVKVDGKYVDAGWFESQGQHPHADMTYPELAHYHATGHNWVTPRDILALTSAVYPVDKDAKILGVLSRWINSNGAQNLDDLLDDLGKVQVERITSLFGSSLLGVTSNPTPLIDSGELKGHTARRTSTNRVVKQGIV